MDLEKENARRLMPTILQEIFQFGIELKVSRVVAGCSRAESYVGEWHAREKKEILENMKQALMGKFSFPQFFLR